MFHSLERAYPDYDVKVVNMVYASVERYCAELLVDIMRNTEAQYTKARLNGYYTNSLNHLPMALSVTGCTGRLLL